MASDREALIEKALKAIMAEPFGCPACDSGKLRRNDKKHWPECGFALAVEALAADVICEHGVAMDIHCCGCHSGFLFDVTTCKCLAALAAPPSAQEGWQPIETAPKDGRRVLLYEPHCEQTAYWADDAWWTLLRPLPQNYAPTHWMPLPPPPAGAP